MTHPKETETLGFATDALRLRLKSALQFRTNKALKDHWRSRARSYIRAIRLLEAVKVLDEVHP